jgi:hypothetical protein
MATIVCLIRKINTEEGGKAEEKSSSGRPDYTPDERIALQSSSF